MKLIPYSTPFITKADELYITTAIKSGWISGGDFVQEFESKISELTKSSFCVATTNGTAAIELAYLSLGLKPGDEVILPAFGFMAATNVAINFGLIPVFADVYMETWLLSTQDVERKITPKTKAVVGIHTYGNVCSKSLSNICKKNNIFYIEDCAEAFMSYIDGQPCGSYGDISIYSFHATKTITTGEGGAITTNNPEIYSRAKLIHSHGLQERGTYTHVLPGMNFRLSNILASLGCSQLDRISDIVSKKYSIYRFYSELFESTDLIVPQKIENNVEPVIWVFAFMTTMKSREFVTILKNTYSIEARPGFVSSTFLPYLSTASNPVADILSEHVVSLPSFYGIKNSEQIYIANAVKEILKTC